MTIETTFSAYTQMVLMALDNEAPIYLGRRERLILGEAPIGQADAIGILRKAGYLKVRNRNFWKVTHQGHLAAIRLRSEIGKTIKLRGRLGKWCEKRPCPIATGDPYANCVIRLDAPPTPGCPRL